eukprot:363901-Chlamydomonas_euryale.AAC.28
MLAGMTAGSVVMATGSAFAKDFNAALAEKEARRAALRDSAGEAKETGKDQGQVRQACRAKHAHIFTQYIDSDRSIYFYTLPTYLLRRRDSQSIRLATRQGHPTATLAR